MCRAFESKILQCLQAQDLPQAHSEVYLLPSNMVTFEPSNMYQMNAEVENNKQNLLLQLLLPSTVLLNVGKTP